MGCLSKIVRLGAVSPIEEVGIGMWVSDGGPVPAPMLVDYPASHGFLLHRSTGTPWVGVLYRFM
jgi:hypothetical protein